MSSQLYIPDELAVGYQERSGTYTGKLAYVIYKDKSGKLRKEASWNSWRSNKIEPSYYKNEPTEGFVLNKKVGGYKSDWNFRQAYVRVYDPRGFEFEITVPNLIFILENCDCTRGKGLEGKFVYAWDKKDLVLLPTNTQSYKQSNNFTELQSQNVRTKSLVKGYTYTTKKQEDWIYIDKLPIHRNGSSNYTERLSRSNNDLTQFIFYREGNFRAFDNIPKTFACVKSDVVHPDYADLLDAYMKSPIGSPVIRIYEAILPSNKSGPWCIKNGDEYDIYSTRYATDRVIEKDGKYKWIYTDKVDLVEYIGTVSINNGRISTVRSHVTYLPDTDYRFKENNPYRGAWYGYNDKSKYKRLSEAPNKTNLGVFAETQAGGHFFFNGSYLVEEGKNGEE